MNPTVSTIYLSISPEIERTHGLRFFKVKDNDKSRGYTRGHFSLVQRKEGVRPPPSLILHLLFGKYLRFRGMCTFSLNKKSCKSMTFILGHSLCLPWETLSGFGGRHGFPRGKQNKLTSSMPNYNITWGPKSGLYNWTSELRTQLRSTEGYESSSWAVLRHGNGNEVLSRRKECGHSRCASSL